MAKASYVCESPFGKADFGARYIRLAEMFGLNGFAANIRFQGGMPDVLVRLADMVARRTARVCLPRAPARNETLAVSLIWNDQNEEGSGVSHTRGSQKLLAEGPPPDGDYTIELGVESCCFPDDFGNCTSAAAIFLSEPLPKGARPKVI